MVYLLTYRLLYILLTINFKEFLSNILPIQKTAISLRLLNEQVCAVKEIVTGNIEAAMNEYNRKKKEK